MKKKNAICVDFKRINLFFFRWKKKVTTTTVEAEHILFISFCMVYLRNLYVYVIESIALLQKSSFKIRTSVTYNSIKNIVFWTKTDLCLHQAHFLRKF